MINPKVIRWRDEMVELARKLLEKDGRLQLVCILRRQPRGPLRGEQHILAMSFGNIGEKDLAAEAVRRRARRLRADVMLLILEVWHTHPRDPAAYLRAGILPADNPLREEAVLFHLETPDDWQCLLLPIHRDGGRVWLGAPLDFTGDEVMDGRFCGVVYKGAGDE